MLKLTIELNGKTVTQEFTDTCVTCLEHDLLDIPGWIIGAVVGKVHKCSERMMKHGAELAKADPAITSIPAKQDDLVTFTKALPAYENRRTREAKSNIANLRRMTEVHETVQAIESRIRTVNSMPAEAFFDMQAEGEAARQEVLAELEGKRAVLIEAEKAKQAAQVETAQAGADKSNDALTR